MTLLPQARQVKSRSNRAARLKPAPLEDEDELDVDKRNWISQYLSQLDSMFSIGSSERKTLATNENTHTTPMVLCTPHGLRLPWTSLDDPASLGLAPRALRTWHIVGGVT